MRPEAKQIRSVSEAIDALNDSRVMSDIQPDASAKRGDDSFGLWFRGHEEIKHVLQPSILRNTVGKNRRYVDEMSLVRHFKAMNPTCATEQASDFDWLVTMQHYLAPTRLLDWTENLLVALYFAVRNEAYDDKEDAALWILNARRLNYHASATSRAAELAFPTDPDVIARATLCRVRSRFDWCDVFNREVTLMRVDREDYRIERLVAAMKEVELAVSEINDLIAAPRNLRTFAATAISKSCPLNLYKRSAYEQPDGLYTRLRMPVAVYASRTNNRIRNQAGVFTLHGGKYVPDPTDFESEKYYEEAVGLPITLEEIDSGCSRNRILKWLRIPKECREHVRKTLARVGVTDATLFPELDYQSRYLLTRWTHTAENPLVEEDGDT